MAGVKFSHPHPQIGDLYLRLPPSAVEWSFKLNTAVFDTATGQVVQVLSTSYDKFTISGRFGKEGPHGFRREDDRAIERPSREYFSLSERGGTSSQPYVVGLTQMTAYFRRYFNAAGTGGELTEGGKTIRGRHDQRYMTLSYKGGEDAYERFWKVYPTSFPSYRRSNEEFAPEWRVEAQVVEPDFNIDTEKTNTAIARIRATQEYRPLNPFSDPMALEIDPKSPGGKKRLIRLTEQQFDTLNNNVYDYYAQMLPAYDPEDLAELINLNASLPNIYAKELEKLGLSDTPKPATQKKTGNTTRGIRGGD